MKNHFKTGNIYYENGLETRFTDVTEIDENEIESYQSESKWASIAFTIFLVVAFIVLLLGWAFI